MTAASGRRAARRTALFLLYQWDVTGRPVGELYEGEIDRFALETTERVLADVERLDATITAAAEGWTADRLGAIERNVLRIALSELDRETVPVEVAIDEAVEAAKELCGADAPGFVNGILGAVHREEVAAK